MADHPNNLTSGFKAQESLFTERLRQLRSTGQIEVQRKSTQGNQSQFAIPSADSKINANADTHDLSEIERLAFIDPLTEQLNSRAIIGKLKKDLSRARRYRQPLALVILEIDGLSSIVGRIPALSFETLLKTIAKMITKNIREVDRCGFYDNNKFMLVCPETNQSQASVVAERLRHCFSTSKIAHFGGNFSVTVSGGISAFPENGSSDEDILNSAFKALNDALNRGGNSITGTLEPAASSFSQYLEKEIPAGFTGTQTPTIRPAQPQAQIQPPAQAQQIQPAAPQAPPTQVT